MVFESNTKPASKLVVTGRFDPKGKPITVAILPNGRIGDHPVNPIVIANGRNDSADFARWMKKSVLLYTDQKKSRKWPQSVRLQLPIEGAVSSNRTITYRARFCQG